MIGRRYPEYAEKHQPKCMNLAARGRLLEISIRDFLGSDRSDFFMKILIWEITHTNSDFSPK
jgi:hypothetical protein